MRSVNQLAYELCLCFPVRSPNIPEHLFHTLTNIPSQWTFPHDVTTDLPRTRGDGTPRIAPAVVFSARNLRWTPESFESVFSTFEHADDVFQPAFTSGAILIAHLDEPGHPTVHDSLVQFLRDNSSELAFVTAQEDELPDGPYFVHGRFLHRAWRLYEDDSLAFTLALAPSLEGDGGYRYGQPAASPFHIDHPLTQSRWEPLIAGGYSGLCPVVAVPSRLHHPVTEEKPLNGLRVTVKDNFHLSGVHTTLGSRSFIVKRGTVLLTLKSYWGHQNACSLIWPLGSPSYTLACCHDGNYAQRSVGCPIRLLTSKILIGLIEPWILLACSHRIPSTSGRSLTSV